MITHKGQTALEYLLIAVVALVVVAVVYNYAQTTSETTQEQGSGIATEVFERMGEDLVGSACEFSGTPTYKSADTLGATVSVSSTYYTTTPEAAISSSGLWINDIASQASRGYPDEWIEVDFDSPLCADAIRATFYSISSTGSIQIKVGGTWNELYQLTGSSSNLPLSFDAREIRGVRFSHPGIDSQITLLGLGSLSVRTE